MGINCFQVCSLAYALHFQLETNQVVVPQVAISYNMYGEIAYLLEPLSEEKKGKMSGNEKIGSSLSCETDHRVY